MYLTVAPTAEVPKESVVLRVAGDLDYGNTTELLDTATQLVHSRPALRDLHFDFSALTFCDSAGLAVLLQVHRATSSAGVQMHLDQRPAYLDRILEVTGLLDYLTGPPDHAAT